MIAAVPPARKVRASNRLRLLPAQRVHYIDQQLRHFSRHQRKVDIELLIGVVALFGVLFEDIEKRQALDQQLFAKYEGNPVVPGQAEFGGGFAGGDVLLEFFATPLLYLERHTKLDF